MKGLRQWFPCPPDYGRVEKYKDVLAGLTVALLLIPQAMAYALLAGVPPVYGVYASLVPMLIYALLSTTPHVSVGPTALASILSLSALSTLATPGTDEYLQLILLLAGLTGLVQLAFGFLRLGVLVSFLSRPVISGFVSAAAVLIAFSQVKTLFGISVARTSYLHDSIRELWQNAITYHLPTTLVGVGSILLLLLGKRFAPKLPATLILIIMATLASGWFKLDRLGLEVVGSVPSGFPQFGFPTFSDHQLFSLIPAALIIALISFVETLSVGKTYAEKHTYYRIHPNRELIALGAAKFLGAFFQAIPTS
ncbi:MAG: SulP family inorganic anion transporter, partial [Bacteroidota bacterium]